MDSRFSLLEFWLSDVIVRRRGSCGCDGEDIGVRIEFGVGADGNVGLDVRIGPGVGGVGGVGDLCSVEVFSASGTTISRYLVMSAITSSDDMKI